MADGTGESFTRVEGDESAPGSLWVSRALAAATIPALVASSLALTAWIDVQLDLRAVLDRRGGAWYAHTGAPLAASLKATNEAVGTWVLVTAIGSSLLFIAWFWRAYANLWKLGAGDQRLGPVWGCLGWLVPCVSLVVPYFLSWRLWRGSIPWRPGQTSWRERSMSPLGAALVLSMVVVSVYMGVVFQSAVRDQGDGVQFVEGPRRAAWSIALSFVGTFVASAFLVLVTSNQVQRLAQVTAKGKDELPRRKVGPWLFLALLGGGFLAVNLVANERMRAPPPGFVRVVHPDAPSVELYEPDLHVVVPFQGPTKVATLPFEAEPVSPARGLPALEPVAAVASTGVTWGSSSDPSWRPMGIDVPRGAQQVLADPERLVVVLGDELRIHGADGLIRSRKLQGGIQHAVLSGSRAVVAFGDHRTLAFVDLVGDEVVTLEMPAEVKQLAVDPQEPRRVYAIAGGNLLLLDGGRCALLGRKEGMDSDYMLLACGRFVYWSDGTRTYATNLETGARREIRGRSKASDLQVTRAGWVLGVGRTYRPGLVANAEWQGAFLGELPGGQLVFACRGGVAFLDPWSLEKVGDGSIDCSMLSTHRMFVLPGSTRLVAIPREGPVQWCDLPRLERLSLRGELPAFAHPLEPWEQPLTTDTGALRGLTLEVAPAGVELDPSDGVLRWRPTIGQLGEHTIRCKGPSGVLDVRVTVAWRDVDLEDALGVVELPDGRVAWWSRRDGSRVCVLDPFGGASTGQRVNGAVMGLFVVGDALCVATGYGELVVLDAATLVPRARLKPAAEQLEGVAIRPTGELSWIHGGGVKPALHLLDIRNGEIRSAALLGVSRSSQLDHVQWLDSERIVIDRELYAAREEGVALVGEWPRDPGGLPEPQLVARDGVVRAIFSTQDQTVTVRLVAADDRPLGSVTLPFQLGSLEGEMGRPLGLLLADRGALLVPRQVEPYASLPYHEVLKSPYVLVRFDSPRVAGKR